MLPVRGQWDDRFEQTIATWRMWSGARAYDGPWQQMVARSLALNLLVHAPSGAVAAAATTSLPEEVTGQRNWDYRFCWIRDAACTLDALLRLGCAPEARADFWWLLHASQLTRSRLQPPYQSPAPEWLPALAAIRACPHPGGPHQARRARPPGSGVCAFLLLRVGFTVRPIVFGIHKFTDSLGQWLATWRRGSSGLCPPPRIKP